MWTKLHNFDRERGREKRISSTSSVYHVYEYIARTNIYVMTYLHAKLHLSLFFGIKHRKLLFYVGVFFPYQWFQHVPRHVVFVLLILILSLRSSFTKWTRALPRIDRYVADVNVIHKIHKCMNKLTWYESILCFGCHLLSFIIMIIIVYHGFG